MNDLSTHPEPCTDSTRHDGWTRERKVQFLTVLAESGNVRLSARRCGMSAQAAYVLRRREPEFARGWTGALVLARDHAYQALRDRAIEGVEEPVFYRGEQVGVRRRYDTRLLLAHIARLEKLAWDKSAKAAAGRFDELLAIVAGEAMPDAIAPAADGPWPQDRADFAVAAAVRASAEIMDAHFASPDCYDDGAEEAFDAALITRSAAAAAAAEAEWDIWFARACARVDRAVGEAPADFTPCTV